jgi:hypothetical protein
MPGCSLIDVLVEAAVASRVLLTCLVLLAFAVPTALAADTCLPAPYESPSGKDQMHLQALLEGVRPVINTAPSLAAALEEMTPDLCLADRLDNAEGYLDLDRLRIVLQRNLPSDLQRAILLHELRHLDQIHRGLCPADTLAIREHARAVFAMEADASAVSLALAWDERQHGRVAIWDALLAWPSQADIAARYEEARLAGADTAAATAAAFDQWYRADDRRERYYLDSCSAYLDRQEASRALAAHDPLPEDFLERLCRLPDGGPYPCVEVHGGRR